MDKDKNIRLLIGARHGDLKQVVTALKERANLDFQDSSGWTPLIEAVNHGHVEIIKILLKAGADINKKDCGDGTALYYADSVEVAEILIDAGAEMGIKDIEGMTPAEYKRKYGNDDRVADYIDYRITRDKRLKFSRETEVDEIPDMSRWM